MGNGEDTDIGPIHHIFPDGCAGQRLDRALAQCFPRWSRTRIRTALDRGWILCDGEKILPQTPVEPGQAVTIHWREDGERLPQPREGILAILFEDEHLLAIDKPPGQVVYPTPRDRESLVEVALAYGGGNLARAAGAHRPGVVHRLDRGTSGVLVFAKTDPAYHGLVQQFGGHRVEKFYTALGQGIPEKLAGSLDGPIGRDPRHRTRMAVVPNGRPAHTEWKVVARFAENFTHFSLKISSGRPHQIRVHLSSLGHPILGDGLYGFSPRTFPYFPIPRILLHAREIRFLHPVSRIPLILQSPLPEDMKRILDRPIWGRHPSGG